tara:strand:+ start:13753 stop:15690 length:1938 start_codon:yes stop_codon:yes gene_type:complete
MAVRILLPDNSEKTFDHEPSVLEVAESIGPRLAKDTLAGKVDGEIIDFRQNLKDGTKLEIITTKSPEANEVIRHSAAHVMAQAVQELWPDIQVTIGPVIENGFYYDFYSNDYHFKPEDLEAIEKKMAEIVNRKLDLKKEVWPKAKAIEFFKNLKEDFKVQIIEDLDQEEVSVYFQGDWVDLCRGPHVQNTSQIKSHKVLSVAGAYWRGDESREQLQRIYATAFYDKKDLKKYLHQLEEAKKRDHRKLGKELNLFHFSQLSPGMPFFTAAGSVIYNELVKYLQELYLKYDYQEVITPQLFDTELFVTSGHIGNYKENMYFSNVDEREFSFKPMNCPGHCVLYGMEHHSYKELPYRMADFGRLHRYERSGVMHGLNRVRTFCQDDGHIFCTEEQLQAELVSFMNLLEEVYHKLGLTDYKIYLSTRPEKREGSDAIWDQAEKALEEGLKQMGHSYILQEGEGAFYGPKIEVNVYDVLGRPWQLGTIQCDFVLPEKFQLKYVGEDNQEHRPVMLHRAILGSFERFIGVYIEHTAGKFPAWLAPVQVQILNVTDAQKAYCEELESKLKNSGLRVHFDQRNEKLGYKIREATLKKVPYMMIIGDQELDAKNVSLRLRNGKNVNAIALDEFIASIKNEVRDRQLNSPYEKDN